MSEAVSSSITAMNRVQWMSGHGRQIFGEWTTTLLQEADTPEFWRSYENSIVADFPGVQTSGVVLGPDEVVRHLTSEFTGALTHVDKEKEIGKTILLPHKDAILRFTGAADRIARNRLTSEEAVLMGARDSLRFAVGFSAGVVNDVFLQNTFRAYRTLRRNWHTFARPNSTDKQAAYHEVVVAMDDWWNPSLVPPSFQIDDIQPEGLFELHKLVFSARSLGNVTLIDQLEAMTAGGFDALGDGVSMPVESAPTNTGREDGWVKRAARLGVKRPAGTYGPFAVLDYDRSNDTFHSKPMVISRLHDTLREQNNCGLPEKSFKTAGNLPSLEPSTPFSRGCPVAGTGIIALSANFTRKAYERVVGLHQAYWK